MQSLSACQYLESRHDTRCESGFARQNPTCTRILAGCLCFSLFHSQRVKAFQQRPSVGVVIGSPPTTAPSPEAEIAVFCQSFLNSQLGQRIAYHSKFSTGISIPRSIYQIDMRNHFSLGRTFSLPRPRRFYRSSVIFRRLRDRGSVTEVLANKDHQTSKTQSVYLFHLLPVLLEELEIVLVMVRYSAIKTQLTPNFVTDPQTRWTLSNTQLEYARSNDG